MCVEVVKKYKLKLFKKCLHPFKNTRTMNGLNKWFSEDRHRLLFVWRKLFLNEMFLWLIRRLIQKDGHMSRFSEGIEPFLNQSVSESVLFNEGIVFDQIISLNDSMTLRLLSCNSQESFLNKSVSNRIGLVFWRNHLNKLVHRMIHLNDS